MKNVLVLTVENYVMLNVFQSRRGPEASSGRHIGGLF